MRVMFRVNTLSEFIEAGQTVQERREAAGEIRYGPLLADQLSFRCEETWASHEDEPELRRVWGQRPGLHWLVEAQGDNRISEAIQFTPDPNLWEGPTALTDERIDGSPVDVRTRRAVEGLAHLVRSFTKDGFRKWMACDWSLLDGTGSADDPWLYRTFPFGEPRQPEKAKSSGSFVEWVMRLSIDDRGVINAVDLREVVVDANSGEQRSLFRTSYTLELLDRAWPSGAFDER